MDHDIIIIGGGAGGLGAARAARWAGADVLLINDGALGGDCTFTGCVPSKTLLSAGRDGFNYADAMARVQATIERIAATETADVLRSEGVQVIEGRARLTTRVTVAVGSRRITAPRIIIATGSTPIVPPIEGIEGVEHHTNESIFRLGDAPHSLGIVGGGPIGCELAEAFTRLGVGVTLFEGLDRLLSREEPAASTVLQSALRRHGVVVRTATTVDRVEPAVSGGVVVHAADKTTEVDRLLVATGRRPNTDGLGLGELGISTDRGGFITTNDRLETDVKGVYAVGDVTGKLAFTHAADEMGRLAAGNALGKGTKGRFRTHWIPGVTFTSPEIARIGMTEAEAGDHGGRVAELPLSEMDRAITDGSTEGYIKLITGPRQLTRHLFGGHLIGATIVAPRAGEMIHEVALAMRANMFTGRLAQTVHAYPTWSYGIQKAAGQFFGEVEGRRARPCGG